MNKTKSVTEMNHEELAQWCASLCIMFGCRVHDAYRIASLFVESIHNMEAGR